MLWVWTTLRLLLWFSWPSWSFLHWMLNHSNLDLAPCNLRFGHLQTPGTKKGPRSSYMQTSMAREQGTGGWVHYSLSESFISAVLSAVSGKVKMSYMKHLPKMGVLQSLNWGLTQFRKILKCWVKFCSVQSGLQHCFWKKDKSAENKCLAFCSDEGETRHAGVGSLNSLFKRRLVVGCGIQMSLWFMG